MSSKKLSRPEALVLLNSVAGLMGERLKKLLARFSGDPSEIFSLTPQALVKEGGLTPHLAQRVLEAPRRFDVRQEIDEARKKNVRILTVFDDDYPKHLKDIYDPPPVLYVRGGLLAVDENAVAVVGSRGASYYGLSCARAFASALAGWGITVVSGMARGIDTEAHRAALSSGGRTLAVLGSGLNHIYPPENEKLFEDIAACGAAISQFPLDAPPVALNFPIRNRVISGLSLGTVVVEASQKSGALITARLALEQGREVFAVPGKVSSPTSCGTNDLIKDGAHMVTAPEEIIEALHLPLKRGVSRMRRAAGGEAAAVEGVLDDRQNSVIGVLSDEPLHIDEISEKTGLDSGRVMGLLLELELKKHVRQLPGKTFVLEDRGGLCQKR